MVISGSSKSGIHNNNNNTINETNSEPTTSKSTLSATAQLQQQLQHEQSTNDKMGRPSDDHADVVTACTEHSAAPSGKTFATAATTTTTTTTTESFVTCMQGGGRNLNGGEWQNGPGLNGLVGSGSNDSMNNGFGGKQNYANSVYARTLNSTRTQQTDQRSIGTSFFDVYAGDYTSGNTGTGGSGGSGGTGGSGNSFGLSDFGRGDDEAFLEMFISDVLAPLDGVGDIGVDTTAGVSPDAASSGSGKSGSSTKSTTSGSASSLASTMSKLMGGGGSTGSTGGSAKGDGIDGSKRATTTAIATTAVVVGNQTSGSKARIRSRSDTSCSNSSFTSETLTANTTRRVGSSLDLPREEIQPPIPPVPAHFLTQKLTKKNGSSGAVGLSLGGDGGLVSVRKGGGSATTGIVTANGGRRDSLLTIAFPNGLLRPSNSSLSPKGGGQKEYADSIKASKSSFQIQRDGGGGGAGGSGDGGSETFTFPQSQAANAEVSSIVQRQRWKHAVVIFGLSISMVVVMSVVVVIVGIMLLNRYHIEAGYLVVGGGGIGVGKSVGKAVHSNTTNGTTSGMHGVAAVWPPASPDLLAPFSVMGYNESLLYVSGSITTFDERNNTGMFSVVPMAAYNGIPTTGDGQGSGCGIIPTTISLRVLSDLVVMTQGWSREVNTTRAILEGKGETVWSVEYNLGREGFRGLKLRQNPDGAAAAIGPDGRNLLMGGGASNPQQGPGSKAIALLGHHGPISRNPTSLALPDSRLLVIGGIPVASRSAKLPQHYQNTMEYLPRTVEGPDSPLVNVPFLDSVGTFSVQPVAHLLSSGRVLLFAGGRSTVLDNAGRWSNSAGDGGTDTGHDGIGMGGRSAFSAVAPFHWVVNTSDVTVGNTTVSTSFCAGFDGGGLRVGTCPAVNVTAVLNSATGVAVGVGGDPFQFVVWRGNVDRIYGGGGGSGGNETCLVRLVHLASRLCLGVGVEKGDVSLSACDDGGNQLFNVDVDRGVVKLANSSDSCLGLSESQNINVQSCVQGKPFVFQPTASFMEYPVLPGPPRTYPWTGSSFLLPLFPSDNYTSRVLICGGGLSGSVDSTCGMIIPDQFGATWDTSEPLRSPRVFGHMIHLPDGSLLLLGGAKAVSGGVASVANPAGNPYNASYAPNLQAEMYIPSRPKGSRWVSLGSTTIPRLVDSVVTLVPDGRVMIAGGGPGEYRIEYFHPPYLKTDAGRSRPMISFWDTAIAADGQDRPVWRYGGVYTVYISWNEFPGVFTNANQNQNSGANVTSGSGTGNNVKKPILEFCLIHTGGRTRSFGHSARMVWLNTDGFGMGLLGTVRVVAPPSSSVAPPGWYLLFGVLNGVPSVGRWVQVSSGGDDGAGSSLFDVYF
ncbi:hypothetical protein HDU76_012222 [Blyttiomyces sp. JEL0837]|nr:hypothetical protein HDU76_012222 [Blyttiomyces sp. JEL0837]